ncbi:MAG: lactate racemase domain-containing protein, partial [Thermogutta sp.]
EQDNVHVGETSGGLPIVVNRHVMEADLVIGLGHIVPHRVPGPEAAPRPPKKVCEKCNREVLAETRICPYCRTYIGLAGSYPKF